MVATSKTSSSMCCNLWQSCLRLWRWFSGSTDFLLTFGTLDLDPWSTMSTNGLNRPELGLFTVFLDTPWIPHGYPMDTPWIPHGYPMDTPWIPHGYPMDTPWIPHGYPPWTAHHLHPVALLAARCSKNPWLAPSAVALQRLPGYPLNHPTSWMIFPYKPSILGTPI